MAYWRIWRSRFQTQSNPSTEKMRHWVKSGIAPWLRYDCFNSSSSWVVLVFFFLRICTQTVLLLFQLKCCGFTNYTDFTGSPFVNYHNVYPDHCCNSTNRACSGAEAAASVCGQVAMGVCRRLQHFAPSDSAVSPLSFAGSRGLPGKHYKADRRQRAHRRRRCHRNRSSRGTMGWIARRRFTLRVLESL